MLLRPGDYLIKATQPGYSPAQLQAKVTSEPNQTFSLKLAKLPGHVRVDVPAQARVTVDGKELGNAPGEFTLAPGKHTIAIAAARYQPFTGELEVTGEGKNQTFTPQLVPAWAEVTVNSEPAGAKCWSMAKLRGVTPLTTQIMAGNHPVELRLEGFKPWTTDVQVKAQRTAVARAGATRLARRTIGAAFRAFGRECFRRRCVSRPDAGDIGVAARHCSQRRADACRATKPRRVKFRLSAGENRTRVGAAVRRVR